MEARRFASARPTPVNIDGLARTPNLDFYAKKWVCWAGKNVPREWNLKAPIASVYFRL